MGTHDVTDSHNARVSSALRDAGLKVTGSMFISTDTVPWNANRWAYYRRTKVTPVATSGETVVAIEQAVKGLPDIAELVAHRGDKKLRSHVTIIWTD